MKRSFPLLNLVISIAFIFIVQIDSNAQYVKRLKNDKKGQPIIPVGWDAYRKWDLWPMQRIGARAYMRSTYNRSGGNSDMSNFLFMKEEDYNVTLDVQGGGCLYFFRTNFWHGSPWHFKWIA